MNRPPVEVADIIRAQGDRFIENNRSWLHWKHIKVLHAIARCRTAALGGHRDQCPRCGYQAISYNSCRNRHCPKCQTAARDKWLAARQQELLPLGYFHVVFTLPQELSTFTLWSWKFLRLKPKTPFKSHKLPHPPQTPAAHFKRPYRNARRLPLHHTPPSSRRALPIGF